MSTAAKNMKLPPFEEIKRAYTRKACQRSLAEFVKAAWHVLEPTTPLTWGKIVDVMCEELERIVYEPRFQPRLLMNVPPGTMKSMLVSVMFPAWVWTNNPEKSFTGVSHEQGLAIRDARKMRLLVESDWYQEHWPLKMAGDANAKTLFENEKRGFRQAIPFRSMTGRRSSFVLVDDPHSAEDANSAAYREEIKRIFRETLPTRVNNDESAIIIIMQRLHQEDVSGIILEDEKKFGYETLILPMRFEKDRADPKDWRKEEGELLFPERFSEESVTALERLLLSYGSSGQLQQNPSPRGGGLFKHEWFAGKILEAMPHDIVLCRGYDLAASIKDSADYTASVKMGKTPDGKIVVCHAEMKKLTPQGVQALVKQNAMADEYGCRISIPRDPGAAAFTQVELFSQNLMGYDVRFSPESGNKQMRVMPFAAQAEAGNVYLLKGEWNTMFLEQLTTFPTAKHDDAVDGASRAFSEILLMTRPTKQKTSVYGGMII